MNKAIFLDRDGVINHDLGYVHKKRNFIFMDGIFQLTKEAMQNNYKIIVVTNQAGIGRGYYKESDFCSLTEWMIKKFDSKKIKIDGVYFSPYHPVYGLGKYKKNHISRKPNPGMINNAISEFNIDPSKSILIGDKVSDIEAGINAKVKDLFLFDQDADPETSFHNEEKYFVINSLSQVVMRNEKN